VNVLLDTCVAVAATHVLRAAGHEVDHVGEWPKDPGDAAILAHALERRQVVVTIDKDFGEPAVVRGHAHCGIVRLVDLASSRQGPVCVAVLARYESVLLEGGIVTAEPTRTRVRPPDARDSS
jgi:predicted nuclease of predicted toxin-antitoxin system